MTIRLNVKVEYSYLSSRSLSLNIHRTCGVGKPVATQGNKTLAPRTLVTGAGCTRNSSFLSSPVSGMRGKKGKSRLWQGLILE